MSTIPRLFSKDLALKDLPRLYKAADAFVLPTRGSGESAFVKNLPDDIGFAFLESCFYMFLRGILKNHASRV